MDDMTTVQDLKTVVEDFVEERDWAQFHSPKNLSMALAIEASELMDLFKWKTVEEAQEEASTDTDLQADEACSRCNQARPAGSVIQWAARSPSAGRSSAPTTASRRIIRSSITSVLIARRRGRSRRPTSGSWIGGRSHSAARASSLW